MPRRSTCIGAVRRPPRRRWWLAGLVAALLGLPGAAYPRSLSHLLQLPLEALLQLEISGPAAATRLRSGASAPRPLNAGGRNP
jgi:hypothetical protein